MNRLIGFTIILFLSHTLLAQTSTISYQSEELIVHKLSENSFVHETFLQTNDWGKVSCNGFVYTSNSEAIIFDTPSNDQASKELIAFLRDSMKLDIKYIVPTHFHIDCLGGLEIFQKAGIKSISNKETQTLAEKSGYTTPVKTFKNEKKLVIGGSDVLIKHYGEGHTVDNVIAYIPTEELVFGGCLVKRVNAGKGNLEDANIDAWPNTIRSIKKDISKISVVIPGHGPWGGEELLDYTIELFDK